MAYTLTQVRVYRAPVERVYRGLIDPHALAKWNPPDGFTAIIHELDARVGGKFRITFVNFSNGQEHTFGGEYLELVPNQRIVATDRFEDTRLPGEIITTYRLRTVTSGTELTVEQQGLPDEIPEDSCRLGWQQCFDLLGRVVEPEIPME
ncbi:MAG: SRPBCC family protein [Pigmentiphaga sp.]|nr:SRPBCC family protein [Pigmentiphaga sp.]